MGDTGLKVFRTRDELYAKTAVALVRKFSEISSHRARIHVGISSGSITTTLLPKVAEILDSHPDVWADWAPIHVWMVDDGFVPESSEYRFDHLVESELCSKFPIFTLHRPPLPKECASLNEAVDLYSQHMIDVYSTSQRLDHRSIALDIALMGMGADGHIGGLFPSHQTLQRTGLYAYEDDAPQSPQRRISMTVPLLRRSRCAWFVVSGKEKASVFAHALQDADFREVPATTMNQVGTTWWVDRAAASQVDRFF